jgi:acyl carrier protein
MSGGAVSVTAQIEEFIREIAPDAGPVESGVDLVEAEVIDSLGIVQLISLLEEKYGITINDDDLDPENFRSVELIATFVEAKAA